NQRFLGIVFWRNSEAQSFQGKNNQKSSVEKDFSDRKQEMRHETLVELAVQWLKSLNCQLVLRSPWTRSGERPDAIGWISERASILIEVKSSKKDFRSEWTRDDRKSFRRSGLAMGSFRYYFAPAGLIGPEDLAPAQAWGLIEASTSFLYVRVESKFFENVDHAKAKWLIFQNLWRLQQKEEEKQLSLAFATDGCQAGRKSGQASERRSDSSFCSQEVGSFLQGRLFDGNWTSLERDYGFGQGGAHDSDAFEEND